MPVCLLVGCAGSPPQLPVATSAHGGVLATLPNNRGYAEILIEAGAGGRKSQAKPRIVAYFFQPDGTSALSPGPTDVKVKLGTSEKSSVVELTPQTDETNKYASAPGTFPDGFSGQLDANLGGETIQVPFAIR
jgi:hypothetical protein